MHEEPAPPILKNFFPSALFLRLILIAIKKRGNFLCFFLVWDGMPVGVLLRVYGLGRVLSQMVGRSAREINVKPPRGDRGLGVTQGFLLPPVHHPGEAVGPRLAF